VLPLQLQAGADEVGLHGTASKVPVGFLGSRTSREHCEAHSNVHSAKLKDIKLQLLGWVLLYGASTNKKRMGIRRMAW
jgi:hypothetical protein